MNLHITPSFIIDRLCKTASVLLFLVMGDFNCSLERDGIRDKLFSKFLCDVNYNVVNYMTICKGANCTFVSYDDMYRSMIDYVCMPLHVTDCIAYTIGFRGQGIQRNQ